MCSTSALGNQVRHPGSVLQPIHSDANAGARDFAAAFGNFPCLCLNQTSQTCQDFPEAISTGGAGPLMAPSNAPLLKEHQIEITIQGSSAKLCNAPLGGYNNQSPWKLRTSTWSTQELLPQWPYHLLDTPDLETEQLLLSQPRTFSRENTALNSWICWSYVGA